MAINIVSSEIVEDSIQIDGRRQIRERHISSGGTVHEFVWMAEENQDVSAVTSNRAMELPDQLLRELENKENSHGLFAN